MIKKENRRVKVLKLSALLFSSTVLALLSLPPVDAYADNYNIRVEGVGLNSDHHSGNGWDYDERNHTLTLKDARIEGTAEEAAISAGAMDLTIKLEGENTVNGGNGAGYAIEKNSTGTLKIIGPGKLTTRNGIYSEHDISIKNADVTVNSGYYPAISAGLQIDGTRNGFTTAAENASFSIIDSKVSAKGGLIGILASGAFEVSQKDGTYVTEVRARSGVEASDPGSYPAILANDIKINDGLYFGEPRDGQVQPYPNGGTPGMKAVYDGENVADNVLIVSDMISAKVTFKVVNGSWDDGTKDNKTVILKGNRGDTLKLKAEDIPGVGNKPDEGYKAGNWDVTPDTKTAIDRDTAYTYSYRRKQAPSEHEIRVTSGGNGTAKASEEYAPKGMFISLSATPDDGYRFKDWKVIKGGISIANNGFTMPDEDVEIGATFEELPAGEHSITVQNDGHGTGAASKQSAAEGTKITLKAVASDGYRFSKWKVLSGDITIDNDRFTMPDENVVVKACFEKDEPDPKDDDDDDDHEEHKPASWELNPNEKQQLVIVWKGTGTGLSAGYQDQGDIAMGIIRSAIPAGWKEAFSFDLLVNGKTDTSLKNGTMTLYIPSDYLKTAVSAGKAGRKFAIVAMDKNGKTYLLNDTDTDPNTITVNVAFEGYAMELIYLG